MLKKPETPLSTTIADLRNTITINDDSIIMIAQPQTMFKLLRALNHWIDNLLQHHPTEDIVNKEQQWYIKWKAIYPFIRSSKRRYLDVYHMITNDYSATIETATIYKLIDFFKTEIPEFKDHYDIKNVKDRENDYNYFEFTLNLYFSGYKDNNNSFSQLDTNSYVPFTNNASVTTWKTTQSQASSLASIQSNTIPQVVHTETTTDANNETTTSQPKDSTNDTDLSYSPNPPSDDIKLEKSTVRFQRNIKRTEDLKQLVSNTCKNEIKNEMITIRDEMTNFKDTIKSSILDQTKEIAQLIKPKVSAIPTSAPSIIPSMYRSSMPSPKHTHQSFHHKREDNDVNSNEPSDTPKQLYNSREKPYQRSGTLTFTYENDTYELRDSDFNKHSADLLPVTNSTDLIRYYKQLQSMAVTFNIFMRPFDQLIPWDKAPNTVPTTSLFTIITSHNNTIDAYRRMSSSIYTKLTKSTFHNPEYNAIINHGGIHQDGFEILYDLMTHCHPKLVTATTKFRQTNHKPTLDQSDSIYSFANKLQVWLDIERINDHEFTDDEILNMILEQMRNDTKYDIAIAGINSELTIRDTFQRQWGNSIFPEGLKLKNIPGTVMSYYTDEDKKALFPKQGYTSGAVHQLSSTDEVGMAIVNSFRDNKALARESIDKMCPGCGKYGHSVFHQGCDFCANFLLASEFFKKYPKASTKVLEKYKDHQEKRKQARKSNSTDNRANAKPNKRKPYNTRSTKARVQMLSDMLTEVLEVDDESSSSASESYTDAKENEADDSHNE
jgi:hypothetical protein